MKKILIFSYLVGLLFLGFHARTLNMSKVITGKGIDFTGPDSYYHMRRIFLTIEHYPKAPIFDVYLSYPYGANCIWPPLFDLSIATLAKLANYQSTDRIKIETLGSYFPVLAGCLTILAIYFLGKMLFGTTVGLISAFLISISPGHVHATLFGNVDHHAIEPLFTVLILYFACGVLGFSNRVSTRILLGLVLGFSLFGWQGSVMIIIPAGLYILVVSLLIPSIDQRNHIVTGGFIAYLVGFILITPYCLSTPWGKNLEVTFTALSLFHVFIFLFYTVVFAYETILTRYFNTPGKIKGKFFIQVILFVMLIMGTIILVNPEYLTSIVSGSLFLGKTNPWIFTISESQSLFKNYGIWSPEHAEQVIGYSVYLLPIIFVWLIYRLASVKHLTIPGGLFLLWSVIITITCLYQRRYVHQLAVINALFFAFFISQLMSIPSIKNSGLRKTLIIILILLLMYPVGAYYFPLPGNYKHNQLQYSAILPPLKETFLWIKKNTPDPGTGIASPGITPGIPSYGIMALWHYGHYIMYVADRPAIANNFGNYNKGLKTSLKFYLTEDQGEAVTILEKLRVKYVLVEFMLPYITDCQKILNLDKNYVQVDEMVRDPNGNITRNIVPEQSFFNLVSTRLFFLSTNDPGFRGSEGEKSLVIGDHVFTLVYESKTGGLKLFEFK